MANLNETDGGCSGGDATSPGRGGNRQSGKSSVVSARRVAAGAHHMSVMKGVAPSVAITVVVTAAAVFGVVLWRGGNSGGDATRAIPQDTGSALLAKTNTGLTGQSVDGIASNDMRQLAFHIHAHLAIYLNGEEKVIPYGVGIVPPYQLRRIPPGNPAGGTDFVVGGSKFYWLHTHDETGVIHVESPKQETFTLGQFFDEWGQQLGPNQIGSDHGTVTAYVNGRMFTGSPRDIPIAAQNVIQLDLGKDVAPAPFTFPEGQ